jgi:hypothetical protein
LSNTRQCFCVIGRKRQELPVALFCSLKIMPLESMVAGRFYQGIDLVLMSGFHEFSL